MSGRPAIPTEIASKIMIEAGNRCAACGTPWPSPADAKKQADASTYRAHHILCAKDEPNTYVQDLIESLRS